MCMPPWGGRKEGFIMEKYCTRCGHEFQAVGREVICPECKQAAAEEAKRAAVLRAKRASWTGESVPVRISGRASTVIRAYGAANGLPFAQALDDILKSSDYFKSTGDKWEEVEPYKSRRRDKHATEDAPQQDAPQQDAPQQDAPQVAKAASKAVKKAVKTSKAATKKAVKTSKAALK